MSKLSREILEKTSEGAREGALLVLEDGTSFAGFSCGAQGESFGEICFNTSLEGYLEVITDPSYAGQIVTMTYPQIGNYGVNSDDVQRGSCALRGLVVRDMCETPSNWRSERSLPDFLKEEGVVAIEGVDTRALVRHIRDNGAMKAGDIHARPRRRVHAREGEGIALHRRRKPREGRFWRRRAAVLEAHGEP